jgi:hypothetical protein
MARVAWVKEEKFTAAFGNDPIVCRSLRSSAFIPLLEATDEISMSANGVNFGLGRAQLRGPLYPDEPTSSGRFGRSEKCQQAT